MVLAYCFGCRSMRTMRKLREEIAKNNAPVIKGNCVICDREMFKLKGKVRNAS